MCFSMPKLTREVQFVCTVGELAPGRLYRDPEGRTHMVTDGRPDYAGFVIAVRLDDGKLLNVDTNTRLGYDREGRMYASRKLNTPAAPDTITDATV